MSTEKQVVSWGALATALLAILVAKPEFFLGIIEEQASVLVPMAAATILALGIPHRFKHYLSSGKYIRALSAIVCISTYMAARALWLLKYGGAYTPLDAGMDFIIASVQSVMIPVLYDCLPEKLKARWSYTALKRVRTASGEIVERPKDQPSGDGEETIIDK